MSIPLATIAACFEGEIPSVIVTSSAEGEPNLAHLSQVLFVDDARVAASNQFFTKTSANLAANPLATLVCVDPHQLLSYTLLVRHERTDVDGEVFDRARRSIELIASATGMEGVFALRSIDVFRVLDVAAVPSRGTAAAAS
ncbi:MAG: Adenylate cyclase [Actinomycetia bacterium]|nr:Adenylate cyclase [Actinomycetes bacterium]